MDRVIAHLHIFGALRREANVQSFVSIYVFDLKSKFVFGLVAFSILIFGFLKFRA